MRTALPPLAGRWFPLRDRAVFRITGPDRVRFLNGQVSNDVSGPLDLESVAACLCNLKGKVEALVWIHAAEDSFLLDGELRQRDAIQARLERYLIADDCEIVDETGETSIVHHFIGEAGGIRSRRLSEPGYDLVIKDGEVVPYPPDHQIPEEELRLLGALSRIPESGHEITGGEFPAELGLDSWAVSFRKGCYLGQEIISRIESVGKVKRRLRLLFLAQPTAAGVPVTNSLGEKGITTRETCRRDEKKFATLGIFRSESSTPTLPQDEALDATPDPDAPSLDG